MEINMIARKWKVRSSLVCVAAALWALPAHAALVSVGTAVGAGTGTLDTATGLLFLDVDRTAGLSYAAIQGVPANYFFPGSAATPGMLAPGQTFAGFRYATSAEVTSLFTNSGLLSPGPITPANEAAFFNFGSLLGIGPVDVSGTGERLAYRAMTGDPGFAPQSRQLAELVIDRPPDPSAIFTGPAGFLGDEQVPSLGSPPPDSRGLRAAGSWLVQAQPMVVPVPATLPLAVLALGALAVTRRALRSNSVAFRQRLDAAR
ncbi:hypothetical protein [Piscinibacter koreensis]|uniref:PEP-CTERM sorting domain-containing protein n=1 Tax=Piscinibacter koreensis TaxID=2742824 RepID=A0A7Y6NMR4_9BURK|nr:hypothetical protein [Schlegelella koreensis]NUZ06025.1 hypothetical protein [Schlegelella koreensis]